MTKIAFILLSGAENPVPSTRISVLNVLPYLQKAEFEILLAHAPFKASEVPDVAGLAQRLKAEGVQVAYFQKVHGESVKHEMRLLSEYGIRIVYGVCDLVADDMAEIADATIVVTDFLRSLYRTDLQHKIHVVHDGIEHPELYKNAQQSAQHRRGNKLKAVLITSSELEHIPAIPNIPKYLDITVVGRYPNNPTAIETLKNTYWQMSEQTSSAKKWRVLYNAIRRPFRKIAWSPQTAYTQLLEADIGIIPVDMENDFLPNREVSYWQVKSENRLTMKMAVGLPVLASPVPSYFEVIRQGQNGFIAHTNQDWLEYLQRLRDPELRYKLGQQARADVLEKYSIAAQAEKLITVLEALVAER